jgi:hypothetical protein
VAECRGSRRIGALVIGVVIGLGGCSSSDKGSGPVATRPDAPLPTGIGIPDPRTTEPAAARRSQPYWVEIGSWSGDGDKVAGPFAIDDDVLQWRATWHCDAGAFSAAAVENGKEARKKIIDAPTCPQDGTGYSTATGAVTLNVGASGPWSIHLEKQIDAPLVEPPPPGLEAAKLVATANMYDVDRHGEGTAKIYQLPSGDRVLRLEDFFVTINSDLELQLSGLAEPHSTDEIVAGYAGIVTVAPLKATIGSMNYTLPPDLDLGKFRSVVIWCEITRNAYAAAAIQPA